MKKTRFLFALFMAIVMMAMSPARAWAEDVASVTIGGTTSNYDDFTTAFTAAAEGTDAEPATLKLLADYQCAFGSEFFITLASGTMTIDLNGHNITGRGNKSAINVNGAKVTITDTSSGTKGMVSGAMWALEFNTGSLTIFDGVFQGSNYALYASNATSYTPGCIVLRGGKFMKAYEAIIVPYTSSPCWDILNMTDGENEYIFVDESGNEVELPTTDQAIDATVSVVLPHSHVVGTGDKSHECTICGKHQGRISAQAGITVTDALGQSISPEDYIWEGNKVNISGTAPEVSGKIALGIQATTAEGSKLQIENNSFAMAGSDVIVSFWYLDIPSDPLCFEALEADAEIYFNDIVSDYILYYSTDNKQTWTQFDYDDNYSLPTLENEGEKIYLFGKVTSKSYNDYTNILTDNGKVAASGKLSSILGGVTTIPDYGCYGMFNRNTFLVSAPDMSDITEIGVNGCTYMFSECSSLTTASNMSNLTTIGYDGCEAMFGDCSSLTTAPDMSSLTTVDDYGCNYMFGYCTLLANVSDMNNLTTIGIEGCEMMFMGCEALTTAPDMSNLTTTGYMGCYEMFEGCTSLTTAPDMSSLTTIGEYGCGEMFYGCTSLTTAPDMSSLTTIGENGCYEMFYGCTSLTTAPDMNSLTTVGVEGCEEMFSGCTSLTTAPAMHSLRTVGYYGFYLMFDECTNLTGFELNTIPNVGEDAFDRFGTSNITLNLSDDSYVYVGENPYFPTVTSVTAPCTLNLTGSVVENHANLTRIHGTAIDDEEVAATCTEPGHTAGKHCSVCDAALEGLEEISALGHTPVTDEAVPATCTESGLTEGSHCEVCGEVIEAQEELPALGHTPVTDEAVDATCTESGLTKGSHCEVCEEVLEAQEEIPALGHEFSYEQILCADGYHRFVCTREGCDLQSEEKYAKMFGDYKLVKGDENPTATIPMTKVGNKYYASLYTDFPYIFSWTADNNNVCKYTVLSAADGVVTLGNIIDVPANCGVIITKYADESSVAECTIEYAPHIYSYEETDASPLLTGSETDVTDPAANQYAFGLSDTGYLGFWHWSGMKIPAWKAYLDLGEETSGARGFRIVFDDETNGIQQLPADASAIEGSYDLMGRKVREVKGLGIVNGKKVFVNY